MITIIVKEPYKKAYSKEIEDELEEYQQILGGYLETVSFGYRQVLVCDEEGKLKNKTPNVVIPGDTIVGTVIVVGTAGENLRSLNEFEVKKAIAKLNAMAVEKVGN